MEREVNLKMKKFAEGVRKEFSDAQIYLFGSRAKNDGLEYSDYDVLVVSKGFEGVQFFERPVKVYDYWEEKEPIDAFCYTPKEFLEKKRLIGFVSEALKEAKKVG